MTPRLQRYLLPAAMTLAVALEVVALMHGHSTHPHSWLIGMTLVVPNAGEVVALKAFLNHTASESPKLKLFKSNTTPAETDTAGTYTEADFTGYAAVTLTGSSWTVTGGAPTSGSYAQQTFTSSADQATQSIYGYFVVMATAGTLMWAERFALAPYSIANNGDNIQVTPQITFE